MKLESIGILVALRPFDEKNAIAHILTRDCGLMTGMLRGAITTKTNKPLVGQIGSMTWNARLDSALGVFHWESEKNLAVPIMMNSLALSYMNAAFDLICTMLPEREPYINLYNGTVKLLNDLSDTTDAYSEYLKWEIELLGELGYAMDLSHCSGCGKTSDLHYISPKTARAVCDNCAAPYLAQLYKMPVTLDITLKFLEKICTTQGARVPNARIFLNNKKI
ncbi:MAG: DNA repair protein RecO [Alphaproteobacteria bacterium]|nr:DNA repair protein RecO [Alphaproteobacteria bacterium]